MDGDYPDSGQKNYKRGVLQCIRGPGQSTQQGTAWEPMPVSVSGSRHRKTLLTLEFLPKHGQEDCEVDGPRSFLHHGFQLLILDIYATWRGGGEGCEGLGEAPPERS